MPTLRVTLNTGETHDVELKPETVVSFKTEIGTGDGRTLVELFAWCDVASIDPANFEIVTVPSPGVFEGMQSAHDALTAMSRAELNALAEGRYGIAAAANPRVFPSKSALAEAIIDEAQAA